MHENDAVPKSVHELGAHAAPVLRKALELLEEDDISKVVRPAAPRIVA